MKPGKFIITPLKGTVIVYDDQPGQVDPGELLTADSAGCMHLDFPVVAVNPEDDLDFGVGDVVLLDHPDIAGDRNHRRMIDGVVYRAVPVEHIIGVKEV